VNSGDSIGVASDLDHCFWCHWCKWQERRIGTRPQLLLEGGSVLGVGFSVPLCLRWTC